MTIEVDASPEERAILEKALERGLAKLDAFFDGKFSETFAGLHLHVGDGLTKSGAEAFPEENKIVFDRTKMMMSPEEAAKPGSCLEYTLIHEVGHLVDEQSPGNKRHRVQATESPTKYGRVPDEYHDEKDHEAFAEGFTYMVYGKPVSRIMETAVRETVAARRSL